MRKVVIIVVGLVLVALSVLTALRLFVNGGEDTWICNQGQWVKHGQPFRPAPTGVCPG